MRFERINILPVNIGGGQIGIIKRDREVVSFYLLIIISIAVAAIAAGAGDVYKPAAVLTAGKLEKFVAFYRENFLSEFGVIFSNNSLAALLMIYFSPLAIFLYRWMERLGLTGSRITWWDRFLLYGFPALFLAKQGAVMGWGLVGFAAQTGHSPAAVFFSIIFPHFLFEALALCQAGALGLAVTGQALTGGGLSVDIRKAALPVIGLLAAAAFLEVAITPRIFAFMMLN